MRDWIGVLAISKKYTIRIGFDQAFDFLRYPSLHITQHLAPVNKLRLAWEFELEDWYDECIRDLFAIPFVELSEEDIAELEPVLVRLVYNVRGKVHRHRLELVPYLPEAIHHRSCPDCGRCVRDWQNAYSQAMLFFAHTRKFFSGREVFTKISQVDIPSFHKECRTLTLTDLESKELLWREELLIANGVEVIKSVIKSRRPSLPRPEPRFLPSDGYSTTEIAGTSYDY